MGKWSREELEEAFQGYQQDVIDVGKTWDWSSYADHFTEDAKYVEHALGNMEGRENIRVDGVHHYRRLGELRGCFIDEFAYLLPVRFNARVVLLNTVVVGLRADADAAADACRAPESAGDRRNRAGHIVCDARRLRASDCTARPRRHRSSEDESGRRSRQQYCRPPRIS